MLTATAPEQEKMDAINTLAFRVAELERAVSGSVDEAKNIGEAENIMEDLIQDFRNSADPQETCGDPDCVACYPDMPDDVLTDGDLVINTLLGHVQSDDPEISLAAIDQYRGLLLDWHDRGLLK